MGDTRLGARYWSAGLYHSFPAAGQIEESNSCALDPLTVIPRPWSLLILLERLVETSSLPTWKSIKWIIIGWLCYRRTLSLHIFNPGPRKTSWRSVPGLHMGLSVPFRKDLLWHQPAFFVFMEATLRQSIGWINLSDSSKPDGPSFSLLFHSSCRASHLVCQVTWGAGAVTGETCRSLSTFLQPWSHCAQPGRERTRNALCHAVSVPGCNSRSLSPTPPDIPAPGVLVPVPGVADCCPLLLVQSRAQL